MSVNKSTGGWLAFRQGDKPMVPGRKDESIFSLRAILTFAVVMAVLVIGGILWARFFGPHS